MMILAKKLSPEGYGLFNVILSLVALFTVFANSGMNLVLTREVTLFPKSTNTIFSLIVPIRIISFLIATISLLIYLYFKSFDYDLIFIFAIILILANNLWDVSESIAFGHLITKYTTLFNLIFSSIWLLTVVFLPKNILNIRVIVICYSVILFLKGIAYLLTVYHKFVVENKESISLTWQSIFIMCVPYLWLRVLGALTDQVPILMLNDNSGSAEVGYFSVGSRLILPITLMINTGLRAVFPFLTKLFKEDLQLFKTRIIDGFGFIMISGTLIAAFLVLTSKYWIVFIFGVDYFNAIAVFNSMAWFGVLLCFDLLLSTCLSSSYKQKILAIITTIDFLIVFPIFYIGANYGALGFANAKLIGSAIVVLYHVIVFDKVLNLKLKFYQMFSGFFFFIIIFTVCTFLENIVFKLFLILTVTSAFALFKESPVRRNIDLIRKLLLTKR